MSTTVVGVEADALVMGVTRGTVGAAGDGWMWLHTDAGSVHVCGPRGPRSPVTVVAASVPAPVIGEEVIVDMAHAVCTVPPALPVATRMDVIDTCCRAVAPFGSDDPGVRCLATAPVDPATVIGLLGHGAGLTPAGDDAVCGYLAAQFAINPIAGGDVGRRVLGHLDRTGEPSASLVRAAAQTGRIFTAGMVLLGSLLAGDHGALPAQVRQLATLGQSTGRAMITGIVAGLANR